MAAWAFAAGALIPAMGILNAGLSRATGSAPVAAVVLFIVALVVAALTAVLTRQTLPTVQTLQNTSAQLYLGGFIVAFYVLSVTVLVPTFGVGNTILFAMTAQIFSSALIDNLGLLGAAVRPVSSMRLGGMALMLIGLVVVQLSASR
jgi:bacterial/archaeal transporter family-2 protein